MKTKRGHLSVTPEAGQGADSDDAARPVHGQPS